MTVEEFAQWWNLVIDGSTIETLSGDFVCAICPACNRAIPSGATMNAGRHQPEYCSC